jgi:Holliday junction resolvase RusA-like endonuclease|tara:strand:- start:1913 stop:2392 length:480 start_codon:yes stop_codon:yes gene_type:complete
MELHIVIPGEPVGKRVQARALKMGKVVRAQYFIPKHVQEYIDLVADYARLEVAEQGWHVPEDNEALCVDVDAYFPVRKSWSRQKTADALAYYHTGTPDRDNIEKSVFDGLMGPKIGARTHESIVVMDDGQFATGTTTKHYCEIGWERVEIRVSVLPRLS